MVASNANASSNPTSLPSPARGREPALSGRLGSGEDTKGAGGEGFSSALARKETEAW